MREVQFWIKCDSCDVTIRGGVNEPFSELKRRVERAPDAWLLSPQTDLCDECRPPQEK